MLKQIIEIIIARRGFFTLDQIVAASGWKRAEVKHRLDRLEAEGLIKRVRQKTGRRDPAQAGGGPSPREITYIKCRGLQGRLDRMTASQVRDTAWEKIWRTIRIMRRFGVADLIQLTGAMEDNVRAYLKILARDGWIRKVSPPGKNPATWFLSKDPGPARPRIPWDPPQAETKEPHGVD